MALAAVDRSNLRLGDALLICGAGPIGLVSLLAANAAGAAPIVITDMNETRLQWAKRLVPRVRSVLVDPAESSRKLSDRIVEAMG